MVRDTFSTARDFMRRRKFSDAITVLQNGGKYYDRTFDYWLLLGIAYLYSGDAGSAWVNFESARKIKMIDVNLLLGQAAIFLRRGDTDRAIQYYLDSLEYDPKNKIAKKALEFLRTKGDYNIICRWAETGKLERFYPPIGVNYSRIIKILLTFVILAAVAFFGFTRFTFIKKNVMQGTSERANLSSIVLSDEELHNARVPDSNNGNYRYILENKEITGSYADALKYFHSYRDNAAQIEVNRIIGSNASEEVKQKAQLLGSYLYDTEPTFDTLTDSPPYVDVAKDPLLYSGCFVVWAGRVSNARVTENGYRCDLLVGYDTMERVEGIVPVRFAFSPDISSDRPVTMLARIVVENNRLQLEGKAIYQSVGGALTTPQ